MAQPVELVGAEILDFLLTFAAGNDGGHYQKHDIGQVMQAMVMTAVVFDER